MKKKLLFLFLLLFVAAIFSLKKVKTQGVCNVGGAPGNDTSKIQSAIDSCAGGGEVRLTSGQTATPTSKPSVPGDIDGDGDVDIFDYNILAENFSQ